MVEILARHRDEISDFGSLIYAIFLHIKTKSKRPGLFASYLVEISFEMNGCSGYTLLPFLE